MLVGGGDGGGGGGTGGREQCHDFRRGMCSRGANCRFAHGDDDDRDLSAGGGGGGFGGGPQQCQDFRRGMCNRGASCRFQHGDDDDRPLVNGSYAWQPMDNREFERSILAKNVDRAFLCGCSPYQFLEGTRSELLGPLTRAGYKLKRSEAMQEQWNRLPQREKDAFGFEREAQDLLQEVADAMDAQIEARRHELDEEC